MGDSEVEREKSFYKKLGSSFKKEQKEFKRQDVLESHKNLVPPSEWISNRSKKLKHPAFIAIIGVAAIILLGILVNTIFGDNVIPTILTLLFIFLVGLATKYYDRVVKLEYLLYKLEYKLKLLERVKKETGTNYPDEDNYFSFDDIETLEKLRN